MGGLQYSINWYALFLLTIQYSQLISFTSVVVISFITATGICHGTMSWFIQQPLWVWIVSLIAWPWSIVIVDELCKRHDRVLYEKYMHGMRLTFDTRLGMHSPT